MLAKMLYQHKKHVISLDISANRWQFFPLLSEKLSSVAWNITNHFIFMLPPRDLKLNTSFEKFACLKVSVCSLAVTDANW